MYTCSNNSTINMLISLHFNSDWFPIWRFLAAAFDVQTISSNDISDFVGLNHLLCRMHFHRSIYNLFFFLVLNSWFFINRLNLFLLIFPPNFSNDSDFLFAFRMALYKKHTQTIVCSWSVLFKLWTIWFFFDTRITLSLVWIFPNEKGVNANTKPNHNKEENVYYCCLN